MELCLRSFNLNIFWKAIRLSTYDNVSNHKLHAFQAYPLDTDLGITIAIRHIPFYRDAWAFCISTSV